MTQNVKANFTLFQNTVLSHIGVELFYFTTAVSNDIILIWKTCWIIHWLAVAAAPTRTECLYLPFRENLAD